MYSWLLPLITEHLKDTKYKFFGAVIHVLLGFGFYMILYRIINKCHQYFYWKFFNKNHFIEGKWDIKVIKKKGNPTELYGEAIITQSIESIQINGKHYEDLSKRKLWSTWDSTHAWIENQTLHLNWTATRNDGTQGFGRMLFGFDGKKPPQKLTGHFSDHPPFDTIGTITLSRQNNSLQQIN